MPPPSVKLLDRAIIDSKRGAPLHHQVRNTLRKLIDEHFEDGAMLWPEATLVEQLGISRGTIRQALTELVREGLLTRHPARGTFVHKSKPVSTAFSTIGVFVSEYNSDFLSGMLEHLALSARERGLRLQVYHTFQGEETAQAYREVVRSPQEEGFVLMTSPEATLELYEALSDRGYHTVSTEAVTPDYPGPWVMTNARQVIDIGLEHLRTLGHRRIALLVNEPIGLPSVSQKIERFETLCAEFDLEGSIIVAGTQFWQSSYDAAYRSMEDVWALSPRPTAIFTVSDPGAWAALKWLAQNKVTVPEEVSVLGFEDVAPSRYTHPALTTIRHPIADLARQAITMLTEAAPESTLLSPSLVIRESTGPVSDA